MSGRRFGQVPVKLWKLKTFKALSVDAKLAVLFCWCGPSSTSAGIGEVPDLYAVADLGWPLERWVAAREAAESAGFIIRDSETETLYVIGYLESNRPSNTRHRAAVESQIRSIECDHLREMAENALSEITSPRNSQIDQGPSQRLIDASRKLPGYRPS